ncbi:hypothetical protein N8315_00970 [Octadecabacter sp.]|nr:hypothetical protein [Octadecabacter sp.]MDC1397932.1 hypothetical protein [Octadecabacter sp.]
MPYRGAGGTRGGEGNFFIGIVMMIAVGYLLLRGIMVRPQFGLGNAMYSIVGFPVTTGLVLVPFAFGVGMIFYNSRNWIGWLLAGGSVVALVVGVIASINFTLVRMSAFDLPVIIILLVGGIGLFLRSLRGG